MNRIIWIGTVLCGLAALAAAPSCAVREEQTSEVGQEADGCGAGRYRGSANVDCQYTGRATNHPVASSATCLGDSQIKCTFSETCQWNIQQITTCVSGAPDCLTMYPPEGSLVNASLDQTYNLALGSTLCDPPRPAAELLSYCQSQPTQAIEPTLDAQCAAQTDRNEGSASCCLNCPKPTPLPGLAADGTAATDAISVCSAEDN